MVLLPLRLLALEEYDSVKGDLSVFLTSYSWSLELREGHKAQ